MAFLRFILFFSLFLASQYFAFSQPVSDSLEKKKEATLKVLRQVRTQLNLLQYSELRDSLLNNTISILNVARKLSDTLQLIGIKDYFLAVSLILDTSSSAVKLKAMELINKDLSLKLKGKAGEIVLNLESASSFVSDHDIKVSILINGLKPTTGSYRLYWATFHGGALESLIKANAFEGSSKFLTDPYTLSIKVPGYITFWIQDNITQKLYKCDNTYSVLEKKDLGIDVNFIPLQ